jgi:Tol biopolymer transport system component
VYQVDVMGSPRNLRVAILALTVGLCLPSFAGAQYFGRNKVQYRSFDFKILQTERFDIYYYPEEIEAAHIVARMAERWHARLSRFFGHDLRGRQPIVLYAAAAHFRQTNTVDGLIGEGTGGVTEALKRRVVLPMSGSLADTDHVLGHELVHAFQFDLTGDDPRDRTGLMPGILAFPLWYAEGMAEYLSIGPVDTQTAMWLRDAAVREKLPHIRDLDHPDYFPYRWGHAFWAYVGAKYGDRAVASLIRSAANPRVDLVGLTRQLGTDPDTLTADWHAAILDKTRALAEDVSPVMSMPRQVIGRETGGGRYNVGPRVSPDGRTVAFFSERDRFSVDLFLADADTGRIIRRLTTSSNDPHFDSLQFLNSAGAWSPDGETLAITAIRAGRPVLAMIQAASGRVRREIKLRDLDDAMHPAFAPDGASVVVSGNRGGVIDLFRVTLSDGAMVQLTSDVYADLEAVFTPDARGLVFVSERFSTDLERLEPGPLRLAYLDLATRVVRPIPGFLHGKHLSPQVTPDGRFVTFIADPDGVNNLYRMSIDGGPAERLSSIATGIAGITSTSPALSMAADGRLVFSVFEDDGHAVYRLDPEDTMALVPPQATADAAVLPGRSVPGGDVHALLSNVERGLPPVTPLIDGEPYQRKLALDFLGQPMISGGVTSLGARVVGGMSAVFSDMLGDRALGAQAQIGGTLADFGGQLLYINRRHRWNWAASLAAVPTSIGYLTRADDAETGDTEISAIVERQNVRGLFLSALYPFSTSTRFEVSGSAEALSFSRETRTATYAGGGGRNLISQTRETVPLGPTFYMGYASAALVRDTSLSGATHPIFGERARLEVGRTTGTVEYLNVLGDWRRYFMPVRPWTIAIRGLHYGRYGRDADHEQLIDLYSGYPEFVHGYGIGSFSAVECLRGAADEECDVFRHLLGSRMAVANIEVRAPVPGLFTGEVEYGRLPVDVAFFMDAGVTWTADDLPDFAGGTRRIVRSVGGAVRINLFGLLPLEVAVSRPLDRVDRKVRWQIGIRQGF